MFLRDFWNDFPNYSNLKREAIVILCECHMCHNNAILDMQKNFLSNLAEPNQGLWTQRVNEL